MSEQKYQDGDSELWHNDSPVCPYCGEKQDYSNLFEKVCYEEDAESELTCEHCDKEFSCSTYAEYSFTSYTKDPFGR